MNILSKLSLASSSNVGFKLRWKRLPHMDSGHPFDKSVRLDKLTSEKHPHSDSELVYTINIMQCNDCGLVWKDCGLEYRVEI